MNHFQIDNSFTKFLPADSLESNSSRQVSNACFSYVHPQLFPNSKLIHISDILSHELGFSSEYLESKEFLETFSGQRVIENTKPYSMCYGGHQFGHWAGQLGDGRAINLFETIHDSHRYCFQLKGAGRTPYSRSADGWAVLRSSIREYICAESMYHLGVPSSRSLSLVLTGEEVWRDKLYDGHPAMEPGAIVTRVAPSFLRFGSFEILTARDEIDNLKQLTDYTIQFFYPHIQSEGKEKYVAFFREISAKTMDLMIHWQRVGFVHGVMNTDNMSILGLTIDYGPYGWLDDYDPSCTPNTTDREHRRYRYESQPQVAIWNLVQLANALYPLVGEVEPFQEILEQAQDDYPKKYIKMMSQKLGIGSQDIRTERIVRDLEKNLKLIETDFTIFFRLLSQVSPKESPEKVIEIISPSFYNLSELDDDVKDAWKSWFVEYISIISIENNFSRSTDMNRVNPKYIFRNYMAQMAIEKAESEDYSLISELYELLKNPYAEQPESEKWFAKRPDWARNKVGASTLSCSS